MQDCIFCKIVKGEVPCSKVYETDTLLAFLDIAPVNKGHVLVIAKGHYPTVWDIPAELGQDMLLAVQKVGNAILEATGAEGLNIMMNNLEVAGQLVPHAHWHLIPRFPGDGLELWPQNAYNDLDEMNRMAQAIGKRI